MRILAITSLHPNPFQPNLGVFNRQQFAALALQHELAMISPIPWTVEFRARLGGAKRLAAGRKVTGQFTIEHPRYFFPPKLLRRSYGNLYRRALRSAFDRAVTHFRPDAVLAAWAYPDAWAAAELAARAKIPVVVKVHGSDVLTLKANSHRWHRTRETLHQADGVIAVSRHLAETVLAHDVPAANIKLIYNGVDSALFSPGSKPEARARLGLPQNTPILLYVGNLYPVKGPDILLAACQRLRQAGVDFQCHMIGAGPLQSSLAKKIIASHLPKVVRLAGTKPHAELPDWFRAADALVLPSRSEGVPNVLLEAAACGTPFVASKVGGVPEVAHLGRGWLVPAGDPDSLADGIRQCLAATAAVDPTAIVPARSHADAARDVAAFIESIVNRRKSIAPPVPVSP